MADKFLIDYQVSATPIEQLEATDTSQSIRMIHSSIDKVVGGNKEIDCGSTATSVGYQDYTTVTATDNTINDATGLTLTALDFVVIKIRELSGSNTAADCVVKIGSTTVSWLKSVGESMVIRPSGQAGTGLIIYSTGSSKICKIDIMWGKEVA